MASPDNVNAKPAAKKDKKDFGSFLRAVDVDRLNPANSTEKLLLLRSPLNNRQDRVLNVRLLQATGMIVSAMWLIGAGIYVQRMVGWSNVSLLMPHEMGGFLAGILTPIALFWMIAAFILRSNDVKMYAEALREEIQTMIFPSEEANRRVNNDIERLMRQTAVMSKATRIALSAIEAAREGLKGQIQQMNAGSEETVDRLNTLSKSLNARMQDALKMGTELEDTITSIEQRTVTAEEKLNNSRTALDASVAKIDQSATSTEEAVGRLSQMLRERLESLGSLHQETEEALQNAAKELSAQRAGFTADAQSIEESAYNITDALQKGTTRLYEFSDDALDKAKLIETRLQGQTASIQSILKQADENAAKLETVTSQAVNQSEKVESVLQGAITRLEDQTKTSVDQVQKNMEAATQGLINDVESVSERAKEMTETMLNEVGKKVVDTTSSFAYIQKQIQALVTLFDQRKLQLDETSISARQTAETMHSTLQAALDKVQDTAKSLHAGIGAINVSVNEPITLLENAATMAHQRAGDISQLMSLSTGNMIQNVQKMGEDAGVVQAELHSRGQDIALMAGKIASHLKTISQELGHQNTILDTRLVHSLKSLDDMHIAQKNMSENLQNLQQQSEQATEQVSMSSETIQQRIDILQQLHKSLAVDAGLSKGELDRVSERLTNISTATVERIKDTIGDMTLLEADYHRLSDAGIDNIERLEKGYRVALEGIEDRTKQVSDAMETHLESLQETAENFGQAIHTVSAFGDTIAVQTDRLERYGKSLDDGNNKISINVQSVQNILSQIKDHTLQAVDTFMQQGQDLETQMDVQMSRLNDVGQKFVLNSQQVKDTLIETADQADTLNQKIQSSLSSLKEEASSTEETMSQLAEKIAQSNESIIQQRDDISEVGEDIISRLDNAMQEIGSKASELEHAAVAAQQQAEILRSQEGRLNKEAFFNSTKFIVESLHSLALDFTRMLEGELDEKTWRGYQKGDSASFTRRLLSVRDEETQNKIKTKFKEDTEFRTYVQRYLRQFEEIYDQAGANDHAHLLTSIFMTSDIGKLYQFICTILERPGRSSK